MKKFVVIGGLVVVVIAGIFFGRPYYHEWKHRRFITQANEFIAKSDYRSAYLAVQQALAIQPKDIEAWRIKARIMEAGRSPSAISCWLQAVEIEPNNSSNRFALARAAMLIGNYSMAGQALGSLPAADQNTANFHQLAAMVAIAENNIAKADWHFGQAAKLDPANKAYQFNEAVIHLQAKNRDLVAAAHKTLEQLFADPTFRKDALRHLALTAVKNKDFAQAEELSRELQSTDNAGFEDRILHLSVLQQSGSAQFQNYLVAMKTSAATAAATNADNACTLAGWLISHKLAADAAQWLGTLPAAAQTNTPVRMALADMFVAREDWPGLEELLRDQNWHELEFLRFAELARAAQMQKISVAFQSNWQSAVRAGSGRIKALVILSRLTTSWQWEHEREDLWWDIVQRFPGERWALQALNEYYTANGDTRGLQKVFSTLVDFNTGDDFAKAVVRNNYAAVTLLVDTASLRAQQFAREAWLKYPKLPDFAATYAYSLHVQGKTAEGLKALEALKPEELESPAIALYYGVLLSANGDNAKSVKYLDLAAAGKMLPEEKSLAQAARGQ
jgi:Flp pilus assembly protein TadD